MEAILSDIFTSNTSFNLIDKIQDLKLNEKYSHARDSVYTLKRQEIWAEELVRQWI